MARASCFAEMVPPFFSISEEASTKISPAAPLARIGKDAASSSINMYRSARIVEPFDADGSTTADWACSCDGVNKAATGKSCSIRQLQIVCEETESSCIAGADRAGDEHAGLTEHHLTTPDS